MATFSHLQGMGHSFGDYVYDSYLKRDLQYRDCHSNAHSFGFKIHPDKSIIIPNQSIACLGFLISSTNINLSLAD